MGVINKRIKFKKDHHEYFHLNFDFQIHVQFPELDWMMINYKLNRLAEIYHIELQAFVMLTTHCHLLFRSHGKTENYFTEALLTELNITSSEASLVEPINNLSQYLNTYKYIYRNPVEAGLAEKCEDYRFSSLKGLLGQTVITSLVVDPMSVAQNPIKILNWLNTSESRLYKFNTENEKSLNRHENYFVPIDKN